MAEHTPWAERCQKEVDAFFQLWRERRWLAIGFTIGLCVFVGWSVYSNWSKSQSIQKLETEKGNLEIKLRESERENRGLRETVAPLLARAAREFPGEEINSSLKKVVEALDASRPINRPLASASATVEIVIESDSGINTHYMDQGGYLAFCKGFDALLVTSAHDCFGRKVGEKEVSYRSVFQMPADDKMVGHPVKDIVGAEYLQIEFGPMEENCSVKMGKAIVVINGGLRLEFEVPPQKADGKRVFVRSISDQLQSLLR